MSENLEIGNANHALKSSLDPSTTNIIEPPEDQPAENSPDYEADPADPDTIDPELINAPGLDPTDNDELDTEEESDPALDTDTPDQIRPDFDLPTSDDMIREEIDSGVRDRNSISNPDAGI